MKWILLLFIFSMNQVLLAQSVDEAYKKEKAFLVAQKEALVQMKMSLKSSFNQRKNKAETDIAQKQAELSKVQLRNQELVEEYKAIEKITKESNQMAGQLEKQTLKMGEVLSATNAKLGLTYIESKNLETVKKFEDNLNETLNVITAMSKEGWRKHAFLDEKEQLVTGEVLFNGLFSAWGKINSKIVSLAPYNKDFLKAIPRTSENDIYIFTPDFQKVSIVAAKTWKESIADAIPGVVMAAIMLCVFGLFIMLAKA